MRKEGKKQLFQLEASSGLLRPGWIGLATLLVVGWIPSSTGAQETPSKYFEKNCAGCHTIGGGRLTGPDLKNITKLKDRDWALQFILNPDVMIKSDHKYAEPSISTSAWTRRPCIPISCCPPPPGTKRRTSTRPTCTASSTRCPPRCRPAGNRRATGRSSRRSRKSSRSWPRSTSLSRYVISSPRRSLTIAPPRSPSPT